MVLSQIFLDRRCNFACLGKEGAALRPQQEIGQPHGIEINVAAPEVEHPGDVVERTEGQVVGPGLLHPGADGRQLVLAGTAGITFFQHKERRGGQGRTAGPDLIIRAKAAIEAAAAGLELFLQCQNRFQGEYLSVQSDCPAALGQQPIGHVGAVGHLKTHQVDAAARELLAGLQEIARVGPQAGSPKGHGQCTGTSAEPAQILAILEMVGDIFALVDIVAGDDAGIHTAGAHVPP